MNLITFNEHFAVVASNEGRTAYEKACVAPLFDYVSIRSHVSDQIDRLIAETPDTSYHEFKLPFPILRAEFDLKESARSKTICRYQIMAFAESAIIYFRVPSERSLKRQLYSIQLRDSGQFEINWWQDRIKEWTLVGRYNISTISAEHHGFELYRQLVGTLVAFAMDAMSPNIHMATVQPSEQGRSVQWIKARTHYTLITHGHPANKATVRHGDRIASDTGEELTRMAHNRRAHYKTLKHERYKYARGRRIFVKATWVGPKEWKDEGGKQIYRILEPSDWKAGDAIIT